MNYADGQRVIVGDRVRLGEADGGIVTYSIDDGTVLSGPPNVWDYLKKGVMINFPKYGLIHYVEPEPDLYLIARAHDEEL
jgi:hypothetical protein